MDDLLVMSSLDESSIPPEILEQLKKELERHEAALRLVKEREQEALAAKKRAAQSQDKVEEMIHKFDDVKTKLEATRQNLLDANIMVERRIRVRKTLDSLKHRAERLEEKKLQQKLTQSSTIGDLISLTTHPDLVSPPAKDQADYGKTILSLQGKLSRKALEAMQESTDKDETRPPRALESTPTCHAEGVDADLNEKVRMIEAKCATVREELGQMALSEQYMRTKQAQLLARRKEKEARDAENVAEEKENEAKEMKQRVEELSKVLALKKEKLTTTETSLEKKSIVVANIEKILSKKERRASHLEKQKVDQVMFDKKL